MRRKLSHAVIINRPPAEVFAWLTDISRYPQWNGYVVSAEQISSGPLQVGSQIRVVHPGRQPTESLEEVTHLVPNQTFGTKSPEGNAIFTLEPVDTGTRLIVRGEVEATGLTWLMYRVFLKRWSTNDGRRFKALAEAG